MWYITQNGMFGDFGLKSPKVNYAPVDNKNINNMPVKKKRFLKAQKTSPPSKIV